MAAKGAEVNPLRHQCILSMVNVMMIYSYVPMMMVLFIIAVRMCVAFHYISVVFIVAMFMPVIDLRARMVMFVNDMYPLMRVSMSSKWIPKLFPGDSMCRSSEQQ